MASAASTARAKARPWATVLSPESAPGQSRAPRPGVLADHQRLDALVDIAQPLLQPHHRLAVGMEAEMPGLDDSGMDRPHGNLMEDARPVASAREECIGSPLARRGRASLGQRP